MKMEDNGWCLPAAIGRLVGKLRFYLGNISDSGKFKGTMKMLDLLEEKLRLLQDEDLQRVSIDREEEMNAWLQQVKEAADDAEELVKDMEVGESAIPDVMVWFRSDSSNLLRMKYTIGRLVSVCTEVESLVGMSDLDEDVQESMGNDSASLTPDRTYVVGRDREIAMILDMILDDAHFKAATSLESWATTDSLQISLKGWIIEALQNINLSQQRHKDAEVSPHQKEMGGTIEYTRVYNNTLRNPAIISIVGISGVGKTMLAQLIFNDKRVQKHFQGKSAWVYCTDNIRKEELMSKILVSLWPQHKILDFGFDLNSLHNQLQSFIEGKRFFLVLDDVSDEIRPVWGDVISLLSRGAPGSVVLVTTQLYGVASFMGTTTPILLNPLNYDDLWKHFKHHAFSGNQSTELSIEALESIGRKIADKLHGLPLAAIMIAASLRNYLDEVHWNTLLKSWWWSVSSSSLGIHISASLGVCYCELPAYLRQCLLYCSIFPRNYIFGKYELIQMWIANGFIELNHTAGTRSLEDVAAEWFDELVNRCFLQPTIWELQYVMHNLVRDFAIALTSNEHRGVSCELVDLPHSVRHLSIYIDNMNVPWPDDYNFKNLRSLMLFGGSHDTNPSEGYKASLLERSYGTYDTVNNISGGCSDSIDKVASIILKRSCVTMDSIFSSSKSLRLLSISNMRLDAASACIDDHLPVEDHIAAFSMCITNHKMLPQLTHLRYLDFSYSGITEFPDSLCDLCNLQVLGLRGCRFRQLPRRMNLLISLRHLHADADTIALIHGIGGLTKLQALHEFRVKAEDGHRITELRDMRYIQGSLCISDLQRLTSQAEATHANLFRKERITCLHLKWDRNQYLSGKYEPFRKELSQFDNGKEEPDHVTLLQKNRISSDISGSIVNLSGVSTPDLAIGILECLSPPRNLQKLKIYGYPGCSFPDWMERLRYIQVIEISCCIELKVLPPIGQLEHLRKLKFYELPSMKQVSSDVYGTSNVVFRSLEELSFGSMVNWENWADSENRQFFPSLQKLQINRCYNLRAIPFMALGLAIKELSLSCCGSYSSTVSSYLCRLTCLTHLKVNDCSQKLILPCQNLVSLEYLHLSNCTELCFEGGIFCMTNLKTLHISSCHIITLSLEEEISRLLSGWALMYGEEQALVLKATILELVKGTGMKSREIRIPVSAAARLSQGSDRKRRETPHKHEHIHVMQSLTDLTMDNLSQSLNLDNILCKLSALRTLCLHKISKISVLQEQWLEQIKSIQELEFFSCYLLRKLPSNLSSLSSLKKLSLQSCSQIHSLPSKGLPRNLKELQILGCSHILEARCQKEDGEIWVRKKIQERQMQTIKEYRQKKTNEFWQGWQMYEEEWVECPGEQLKNKGEWLTNEEEDLLKHSAMERINNEDVLRKAIGKDWPKIAHIPYIRVNGDIIQNLYL